MVERRRSFWLLGVAAFCSLGLTVTAPELRAAPPARYAVSTENARATREAMDVLAKGGNAVDAAVTAALVTGVTNPTSSGLGGGGFALVYLAKEKKAELLDFRETAPAGVDTAAFEDSLAERRGQLVGVPGEVAGLYALHQKLGKSRWADLVGRAERAASQGFVVEAHLARVVTQKGHEAFQRDPALKALLYPGGKPIALGQRVKRPNLARTLRRIAHEGPKAFYTGPIAAELVRVARDAGGALSESDLANYTPKERQPLELTWEGHRILTMPPPSAGGLLLAQTLAMHSRAELQALGLRSPAYTHVLAEGMRASLVDRYRYVGDPDRVKVDVQALLEPARLAKRKSEIALDRTRMVQTIATREQGTHHLVALDADGNAVSLTTTVNTAFGADLLAPASGVILNDELDDFASDREILPYTANNPNRALPGTRPVSSMTPTIVLSSERVVLTIGGSGGPTIPPCVTQVLLAHLAFGENIEAAVKAPRFIPSPGPTTLRLEAGYSERDQRELEWRGEKHAPIPSFFAVQAIAVDASSGAITAVADPRKSGLGEVR
jgi:gamma-glutamyltranspeptidase/glutathione hydrolase